MSTSFDVSLSLVVVTAQLVGPGGAATVFLALDTGATTTVIDASVLTTIGIDLFAPLEMVSITMGNGVEYAPVFALDRVIALEQEQARFPVVAHTLPRSVIVDGVLGLDFLRQQQLIIDFRAGLITLV